jgi:hypothetical protein
MADVRQEMATGFADSRQENTDVRQEMATGFAEIRQEMATKKQIGAIHREMGTKQDIAELRQDLSAFRQENRRDHKHLYFVLHKEVTERFTELATGGPG